MIEKLEKLKDKQFLIVLFVLVIPVVLPLLRSEFFHFSDEPSLSITYEMFRAFKSGQFPPRWAPDMSYEYGYPLFNFYYVLPFYLGSLFYYLLGSLIWSVKLVFFISIVLSALLMYAWLRLHTSKLMSLVGSIIYIYTPYRAVDLYVRGAIGELLSFVFFPLVAIFVYKIANEKSLKNVSLLAITIGLFLLTHNLAPMFFLPWIFVYGLVIIFKNISLRKFIRLALGFVLGFGLASFFWIPAFLEKGLLQSQTPYNYIDHFPFIKQLIIPYWGYGASVWGPDDQVSFQIGLVNIALVAVVLITLVLRKKNLKSLLTQVFFLSTVLILVFLMNIRSSILWELTSLSSYIQFPWRLLMLTTFITSTLVVFINNKSEAWKKIVLFLGVASIISTVVYFRPSEYYKTSDEYFLQRSFARETRDGNFSDAYKNYSEDYLLLPIWTYEKPNSLPESKFTSENINIESIKEISKVNYETQVSSVYGGSLVFHSYYFPGWQVAVDEVIVESEISYPYGNIKITLPGGEHNVAVMWVETPLRKIANLISILSLVAAVFLLIYKNKNYEK